MISIMIYLLLLCLLGMLYAKIQFKNSRGDLSYFYIGSLLFLTRLFPLLMSEAKNLINWLAFSFDILLTIYIIRRIFKLAIKSKISLRFSTVMYLLNPMAGIYITSSNFTMTLFAVSIALFSLFCITYFGSLKNEQYISGVFWGLSLLWCGSYGVMYFICIKKRDFKEIFKATDTENVIAIISFIAMIAACVLLVLTSRGLVKPSGLKKIKVDSLDIKKRSIHDKPDKLDIVIILILMLLFFSTAIYKLGTRTIPSTTYEFEDEKKEIVLDMGKVEGVVSVNIFQDYKAYPKVSFSVANLETGKWEIVEENKELKSCFQWNYIFINKYTRYIGIVCYAKDVTFNEIVILNEKGEKILPVNSDEYAELFDEQELFQKVNTYYYQTMFDEVYHARTAYEFLHGYSIYETSHPPLGKSIIALGIKAFGMNPFGWRIASVIAGTLCILVIYLLGLKLTKQRRGGILAGILATTEFMHFALSRIATLDIFVALFILLMFYFMLCYTEKRLYMLILFDGIITGIAIATKWTGVYAAIGLAILFFICLFEKYTTYREITDNKKEVIRLALWCVLCFIVIPYLIYCISFIPFTRLNGKSIFENAMQNASFAFNYHKDTVFGHAYSSEWYEWIWDKRHLLDAYKIFDNGNISTIITLGSPLIVWGGLLAFVYVGYLWRCKGDKNARFLIIMYLANLMPWMLVHRTVFIYHYFPCILTLVLIVAYAILMLSQRNNILVWLTAIISIGLFVMFYPRLSGMEVSREYVDSALSWLKSWR